MKKLFAILTAWLLIAVPIKLSAVTLDPHVWDILTKARAGGPTGGQFACTMSSQTVISANSMVQTAAWSPSFSCSDGAAGVQTVNVIAGAAHTRSLVIPAGVTVRIEARMKASGLGVHTTFWIFDPRCLLYFYVFSTATINANCGNLTGGTQPNEIDIVAMLPGANANTTTITPAMRNGVTNFTSNITVTDYTQNFHNYAVQFTPTTTVNWLVDNVQVATTSANVPAGAYFLVVDQEVDNFGCNCAGVPVQGNYPQSTTVQWIRVGSSTGSTLTPATANIFDEEFAANTYSTFTGFTP